MAEKSQYEVALETIPDADAAKALDAVLEKLDGVQRDRDELRTELRALRRERSDARRHDYPKVCVAEAVEAVFRAAVECSPRDCGRLLDALWYILSVGRTHPVRVRIVEFVLREWSGALPSDGVTRLAEEMGLARQTMAEHVTAIEQDPVLGNMIERRP